MNYKKTAELLLRQDNILILTHKNPDGDTLGSAAALCLALRRAGKTAYLAHNEGIIEKFRSMVEGSFAPESFVPGFVAAVDVAAERMLPKGFEGEIDLCIDHHPGNTHYAKKYLVRSEKASCGEIIYGVIKAMNGSVTKEEATLLYVAVSTDCGCFCYGNTKAETLRTAADLLELGVENGAINTLLFRKVSPARLKLEGMIFSSMSFHRDGKIVVATVTREMMRLAGATEDDCDDLANLPGRAEGGVLSVTIREEPDGKSKISLRSTPAVNANEICAVFGGGGHAMAAGCSIDAAPERAKELLLAVIDEVWK